MAAYVSRLLIDWLRGPPLFGSVEIETASECNRRCTYCPNSTVGRPERSLKTELFLKVIDELSEVEYAGRLSPHFYGEPLLDPRLPDLLAYARRRLPETTIKLFTNGDFLSHTLFQRLLGAGVDVFRIAQHGAKPTHTLANTLSRLPGEVRRRHIEYLDYHDQSFPLFNRGGSVEPAREWRLTRCDFASGLTIDCDGNVVLCCNDYSSQHVFGNVADERLMDIWLKPRYRDTRYRIESGLWPLDICRVCVGEVPADQGLRARLPEASATESAASSRAGIPLGASA